MNNMAEAASLDDVSEQESFSFERVIAPVSKATFYEKYYERAGLVVERNDPSYYLPLLSLDRIDEFLTTTSPDTSQVAMVNAAADIQTSDYSTADGRIDVARVYELFEEGATIILPGLQHRIPELGALCRSVGREFNAKFQTNIYLTPPNAQGFKTHYDTHDVFVLQVSGTKDWRAYDVPVELPLMGQKFSAEKYDFIDPVEEFRLNAGDLYYCPRGLVHDARATDEPSLHITFGLMGRTWTEVMIEAVTGACLSDPSFRENLPVGFATDPNFDRDAARAKFQTLLASLGDHVDFDSVLDEMAHAFISSGTPPLRGRMHQVGVGESLTGSSRIKSGNDLIYRITADEEEVELQCGNTVVTLPAHVHGILTEMMAATSPKALSDFSGDLDEAGRIVLAKRLIKHGFVSAV